MALNYIKPIGRWVNQLLTHAGLRVVRQRPPAPPLDLRGIASNPIEGAYRARDRAFVIDAALGDCRSAAFLPCTAEAHQPFILTLVNRARGGCRGYADSPLRAFYDTWQPAHAAAFLGLDETAAHPALVRVPPLGYVMPWHGDEPDKWLAWRTQMVHSENRQHGADLPYSGHGSVGFGPVSDAKGQLEFNRLAAIYESIRRDGYVRSDGPDGDIGGLVLKAGDETRVLILRGHHRIAALASLGFERAPLRLSPFVIHREDAASWPNVRTGLFTTEQAVMLFDRIFDGQEPAGCNWTARYRSSAA